MHQQLEEWLREMTKDVVNDREEVVRARRGAPWREDGVGGLQDTDVDGEVGRR